MKKDFGISKFYPALILSLFLAVRLPRLFVDFSNTDAWRWHLRSEKFSQAIKNGNFEETYQRYHPGVTIMWITSVAKVTLKAFSAISSYEYKTIGNVEGYKAQDFLSRTYILGILALLLLWQYKLSQKLLGAGIAFYYSLLVSVEPYLAGIDSWYHLTSLEAYLSFTAFLLSLVWAKYKDERHLVYSGILLGLALLTRFSSIITLVLIMCVVLAHARSRIKFYPNLVVPILKVFLPVLLIVFCVFPALWVSPLSVLQKIGYAGKNAVSGDYQAADFAVREPLLFYPLSLVAKLSPVSLILFLISLSLVVKNRSKHAFWTLMFLLLYMAVLSTADQKIERYAILFIPASLLLGAFYLDTLRVRIKWLVMGVVLVVNLFLILEALPFLSLYYSPLIGGLRGAEKLGILPVNGEYYAQAAGYLNAKGRQVSAWPVNNPQSFAPYFKGILKGDLAERPQYLIVAFNDRHTDSWFKACPAREHVYLVDSVEYLTILKCL